MNVFPHSRHSRLTLGTRRRWHLHQRLSLPASRSGVHMHVLGKTGSGKSRFLASLALQLMDLGFSFTLIDPHGELARLVFAHLVQRRFFDNPRAFDRLLYLDLEDAEHRGLHLPLNVLRQPGSSGAIATNIKDAFHRAWPELASGAAIFDTLLPDAVELLIHNDLPLTRLHALLVDDDLREELLQREQDEDLVSSFRHVYEQLKRSERVSYAGSVLRRARQLTRLEILKRGLGQPDLLLDFRRVLSTNQSVILNLHVEDRDARRLLGCLITVAMEQAALSSSGADLGNRRSRHFLILDEFQLFTAQSEEALEAILSEARKFRLHLVLSHQNYSQVPERLQGALQNCEVEVALKEGRADAEYSAKILGRVDTRKIKHEVADPERADLTHPVFDPIAEQREVFTQQLTDLDIGEAFVRLPGQGRRWFRPHGHRDRTVRMRTLPLPDPLVHADLVEAIGDEYLRRYFVPVARQPYEERRLRPHAVYRSG